MKKYNQLFDDFCSFKNLYRAFKKARKGSGHNREVHRFFFSLESELLQLQEELQNLRYQPSPYRYFKIRDPKARTISVAPFRDRVVHHALINILEPIFEPIFIYHSYATRKDKGSHAAILQAQTYTKKYRWFLKTDVDQYFASINQNILLALISKKIRDSAFMDITERVIRNGGIEGKGLPIGNLTSQFFANVYLNPLDHYIKDELGVKAYVRYMDDAVIWAHSRSELKEIKKKEEAFLRDSLKLQLKEKYTFLNQRSNGLSFLGTRIYPSLIRIHPKNLKRSLKKINLKEKEWKSGTITEDEYMQAMNSSWAHLSYFDTLELRKTYLGYMTTKAQTG